MTLSCCHATVFSSKPSVRLVFAGIRGLVGLLSNAMLTIHVQGFALKGLVTLWFGLGCLSNGSLLFLSRPVCC